MVDAGIQLEEEGTGEDCLSLRVVWNKTLIDDMLISFGIDSNATSTRLTDQQAGWINYSLTLSDVTQEKKWKVRLGTGGPIVSVPWRLARQWCERGPGFSLSLSPWRSPCSTDLAFIWCRTRWSISLTVLVGFSLVV